MRAAINAPLQGSAADIIKIAMVKVDKMLRERNDGSALILQIHDELLIEAPDRGEAENQKLMSEVQSVMEGVLPLSVPTLAQRGWKLVPDRNWFAALPNHINSG
jgi:DNA polymerase-1